jgi:hypothetical protein
MKGDMPILLQGHNPCDPSVCQQARVVITGVVSHVVAHERSAHRKVHRAQLPDWPPAARRQALRDRRRHVRAPAPGFVCVVALRATLVRTLSVLCAQV